MIYQMKRENLLDLWRLNSILYIIYLTLCDTILIIEELF